uniref:Ameloblastin n=1 Tax=Sinocyclocheilus anshuiensis TaxID=1608454 RepID=A0A671KH15_9TELE
MRLQALLACFLAGTSGVPISPNADLMESVPVGDMPQFKPEPPRMLSGPQPQLPTLTNPWTSQTNPNTGLSQLPVHFQYLPYPHAQQPQLSIFSILSTCFSLCVCVCAQQYSANAVPASQPLMTQNKQHKPLNQPQQQQVSTQTFWTQNMGYMRRVDLHMPALRGNVFPVAGPQPVVPVSPLRPTKTFHPTCFVGTPQVPCDHVLPAEDPLANTGLLDSDHGPFISAVVPTVQSDPHHSDPTFPTPEYKEALVPASPPLRSDTVNTNTDMYP